MKKLLKYMKGYIGECIAGPLFKLLEALFELFVPLVVAAVIDRGIAAADRGYTVKMCLLLIGLGFAGLLFSVTAQFFAARAAVGFTAKLRHVLFGHIGSLSHTELDELGVSTMMTRMTSDMNQVQNGVNLTLRLLLRSPFVVFGAMIMAFTVNRKAAMIFVYVTALLLIVVFAVMLCSIPLYRKVQQRLDGVMTVTRENLTGVRVIRAFRKEGEETGRFMDKNGELTRSQEFVGRISALMNPVTYVIINMGIIFLIRRGAVSVDTGELTRGEVVALYNYMSQILVELIKLANLIISITRSIACGNRIQAVLEMKPSIAENGGDGDGSPDNDGGSNDGGSNDGGSNDGGSNDGGSNDGGSNDGGSNDGGSNDAYAAELRHAALRYKNAAEASVTDISFTVKRGETVGIIGGTGSGKSSVVSLIPRFYDATEGEVLVGGVNVRDLPAAELRERIGIVPQKAQLFKGTVRENMLWGDKSASDRDIEEAIEAAQAADVIKARGGLDCVIEQGGRNLSGGQRQRLTIARALVRRPELLILDDSASALDYATDAALRKSIGELPYRPAVIIVSQRASSVLRADKIIVMDDGQAVGMGTHERLMESCAVYREIYYSQFEEKGAGNRG